jgi:hypothetical protein
LHVGYDLASGQVDQIELTDDRGAESLRRLTYRPGEIVLADRYYARPFDLRPVIDAGAHFIVRTGWNALRLLRPDGGAFNLFATLAAQREAIGEAMVRVDDGAPGKPPLLMRLVIRRKSRREARAERQRLVKDAQKRGRKLDPRTLKAAAYFLVLTSLPAATFPAADVLQLYRHRWQLELAFKRMKSLAGLDELAAKKPDLARAWIYARLIAFLIAEQSAGQVPDSSPSGRRNPRAKPLALAPHQDRPRKRSCRHPRTSALVKHQRRLHANSSPPL